MTEISAVLARYPADCQPLHVEPLGSAGGMSGAQFWRIAATRGVLALRRWPTEHPSPDRLRFIHAVLDHASRNGIDFLPLPATTRDGQSFISHAGHLWDLALWLPGAADYEQTPTIEKLHAAMRALAKFHIAVATYPSTAAPGSAGGSTAPTRHLERLKALLTESALVELSGAIRDTTWSALAPLAHQFVATLPGTIPVAISQLEQLRERILPVQPCIRDIWSDHVLFTGDNVTGLIDFGTLDIDTPATDIARLLSSYAVLTPLPVREGQGEGSLTVSASEKSKTWQAGLTAYEEVRPLSNEETQAARALDLSGTILAGCNWIRWIFIDGRHFENRDQVTKRFRQITTRVLAD